MPNKKAIKQEDRSAITWFIVCVVILTLTFGFSVTLEGLNRDILLREGGIIESLSLFGYFLCAVLILYKGNLAYLKKYHYFFLLPVFFGLREMDFDRRFRIMGIFEGKFYISRDVPLIEKTIDFMVIMLLLYSSYYL